MENLKTAPPAESPTTIRSFGKWKIANPWLRLGAQAIDQGTVGLVTLACLVLWFPNEVGHPNWIIAGFFLWILASITTQGFFLWFYKNTPGKKILGLSVQSAIPNRDITLFQALMRAFIWWLGLLSLGAGWITVLSRPDRRAWHDLVSDTSVVTHKNENSFITPLQQKMGETWMGLAAVFFVGALALVFTFEFGRLKGINLLRFRPPAEQKALERESWLLLAGGPSYAVMEGPVDDADAPLKELMLLFSRARKLSPGQRFEFYHMNMQKTEDSLCAKGFDNTMECQSARAMAQLLSVDRQKTIFPHALPGLQTFEKMESFEKVSDQIHFLTEKSLESKPGSVEYLALKIAQSRLLLESGAFHAAKASLDDEIKVFHGKPVLPEDRFFQQTLNEVSCEAQALDDCRFDPTGSCATDPYWRQWASGCQLRVKPVQFSSSAQALGFWWKLSQSDLHFDKLDAWENVKKQYEMDNAREFEKYVFRALDLVLNAKAVHPGDLMGYIKALSPENPLWGWAHSQAIKEFGTQWAYLIPPGDQALLNRFGFDFTATSQERSVASAPDFHHADAGSAGSQKAPKSSPSATAPGP